MGRFRVQSSRGHKYILVAYNFDSNSIHVKPIKSRHNNDTIKANKEIYNMLTQRGLKPRLHWLDNEASKALKNFIDKEQTNYQLTPPHIHRRNAAEYAILTFKNHFISGLCLVDKNFPLHLWCRLLDQAELTLNISLMGMFACASQFNYGWFRCQMGLCTVQKWFVRVLIAHRFVACASPVKSDSVAHNKRLHV